MRPRLRALDLDRMFDSLFISSETGRVKPDPLAVEHALSTLGVEPEEAIFVDDKQANLDPAAAMGVEVALADIHGAWAAHLAMD